MKNIINMLKRGDELMPLTMIDEGIPYTIQRIGGKEEIRRFLENLGFVPGAVVTVVSCIHACQMFSFQTAQSLA